jgi:hypothetical protein
MVVNDDKGGGCDTVVMMRDAMSLVLQIQVGGNIQIPSIFHTKRRVYLKIYF